MPYLEKLAGLLVMKLCSSYLKRTVFLLHDLEIVAFGPGASIPNGHTATEFYVVFRSSWKSNTTIEIGDLGKKTMF